MITNDTVWCDHCDNYSRVVQDDFKSIGWHVLHFESVLGDYHACCLNCVRKLKEIHGNEFDDNEFLYGQFED